jgi:hypothetical protein
MIGNMSEITKRDLAEWIPQVMFALAKRDGIPVDGVFKMTFR